MSSIDRGKLDDTLAAMFSNIQYRGTYLFYAHMIGQCSIKIRDDIPSPAGVMFNVDHYDLFINPDMFDKFTLPERLAILKHEMLHILQGHVKRVDGRVHLPWNYATDCAINQLIDQDDLPEQGVTPKTLGEMLDCDVPLNESSEFYYELLKDQLTDDDDTQKANDDDTQKANNGATQKANNDDGQEDESNAEDGEPGKPNMIDTHDTWQESVGDKDLQDDMTKNMIETAQDETIKNKGNIPQACSEWLEIHTRESKVNWKKILRGIVGNKKVGKRSTIMRGDRRFPKREDLRGKTKDRLFNLLVIADVSGSMSDKAVLETLGEVQHICNITKTNVDLIQIDTDAYEPQKLEKNTKLIERRGFGGTQLHPALEKAQEYNIDFDAVVVLTDGGLWGDDIEYFKKLNMKVIWLIESSGYVMDEMNSGKMQAYHLKKDA